MSLAEIPLSNPLHTLFRDGQHSIIYLPERLRDQLYLVGDALRFPNMANFHVTSPLREFSVQDNASLAAQGARLFRSETFAGKSGVFLIDTPEYAVIGFGRQLFSNFVEHSVRVATGRFPTVFPCGETLFKSACCSAFRGDAGYYQAMRHILHGQSPEDAKKATAGIAQFDPAYWDLQSETAMMTNACLLLTDPDFFAQVRMIQALVEDKPIHVIEFNPFDGIWGVKLTPEDALKRILAEYDARTHGPLGAFVQEAIIGAAGNKLGKTWTRLLAFLPALKGGYQEFKALVDSLHIVRVSHAADEL